MECLIAKSLEDIIAEHSKKIPKDEWDRLPLDLIDNLDHYLYGTDKREKITGVKNAENSPLQGQAS